jgi:diguanylate cyclase (GGDEF)-like protein
MTISRLRRGREAVLFVLLTPILMFFSMCLEQVDPHVPGKFAFLVLLGPTLLVALTGKCWQGLVTAAFCGLGCVVAGWVGAGMKVESLSTTSMSMPLLLGAALVAVGTLLTLRCDQAERRIGDLDTAVSRVVAAEDMGTLVEAIQTAVGMLDPDHEVEFFVWEPRDQAFVPIGSSHRLNPAQAVSLFGGARQDGAELAPSLRDWKTLDLELEHSSGREYRVPLTAGDDEVFGFLRFAETGLPHADFGHLLQILANFAGLAIKNILLFERLREQARRDGLTGLVNYATFQDELSHALKRTGESASSLALVLLDLDKFKQVNDRHGHHFGSVMLQRLAENWRAILPADGVLARYGGDEFACILRHSGRAEAQAHVERLIRALDANPLLAGDARLTIKPSLGIAIYPKDAGSAEELFQAADRALYTAKRRGGGAWFASDDQLADPESTVLSQSPQPVEASFDWETEPMLSSPANASAQQNSQVLQLLD